jgi:uncharacterized HAD superfamily protein
MIEYVKLPNTWFIDIDGVIFSHNGYLDKKDGEYETPLPGVIKFFRSLESKDRIILCTARKEHFRQRTESSLIAAGIPYDILLMELPTGRRILINDRKDSGMNTAFAVNIARNEGLKNVVSRFVD